MNVKFVHLVQGIRSFTVLATIVALVAWAGPVLAQQRPPTVAPVVKGGKLPAKSPGRVPEPSKSYEAGGPAPVIKAPQSIHDFGTTWAGPMLEHTFVIKNEGPEPLEILKVRPTCGCTIAGVYPQVIKPGESGEFPFKLNSSKLRGKYEKPITVYSNDPVTPQFKLKLRGECNRRVDIMPTGANFGKLTGKEPQQRVLQVTNNTDTPLTLALDPEKTENVTWKLVETTPGKKFELISVVEPPFEPGSLNVSTTLTTNIEAQKEIEIRARARIPPRLEVSPKLMTLNLNKLPNTSKAFKRPLQFKNYGDTPVKVLSASINDPSIKVEVKPRAEGQAYTVFLEIPAEYKATTEDRIVTLKTDDPKEPEIKVPFRAMGGRRVVQRTGDTERPKRPIEELVGRKAPTFAVNTREGKTVSNDTLADAITVLDFFAPNCGFCKKQIPRVESIRQEYERKGVRFVAVAETMRKKYGEQEIVDVLGETGFKGELAFDLDNKAGSMFKATGFPTMVVLGKSGKVEAVNIGNIGDLETRLKGQLDALIAGKPMPTAAAESAKKPKSRKRPVEEMVGQPAPEFSGTAISGTKFDKTSLAGKVTVLDFFAPNCPHCSRQLPRVEKMRKDYADKGVQFVAVSQTMRKKFGDDEVKQKISDAGFQGDLVIDPDNSIGQKFKATGFPTMVIVGKDGKIAAANVGNAGDLEVRMKGQLDALIAGKPVPTFVSKTPPQRQDPQAMVGKTGPEFAIKTLDGKPLGNAEFGKYQATVLNFVAPNCGYCKRQVPNVEKVRQEYEAKGVRFVNVIQKMRKDYTPEEAAKVFTDVGSGLEMATDFTNSVGREYGARGFPTMVVVGKDGKIANVNVGAKPDIEAVLKGQLDALMK